MSVQIFIFLSVSLFLNINIVITNQSEPSGKKEIHSVILIETFLYKVLLTGYKIVNQITEKPKKEHKGNTVLTTAERS